MKKFRTVLIMALIIFGVSFGVSSTASALQYGFGYSELDLHSFAYSDNVPVYARSLGVYSTGYAFALDQDEVSSRSYSDIYFNRVLNDWRVAYTSDAFAAAGTYWGTNFSVAEASAGGDNGVFSQAWAGTYVSAYQFYVPNGGDLSISIDYYLDYAMNGDGPGYSLAGSSAMLGIYQGETTSSEGQWLDMAAAGYGYDLDENTGTLNITLTGLDPGSRFSVFAGTAAYAMAYAPGDNTAPVPEPATMLLLGTGLIGIAGFSRKKLKK